MKSRIEVDEMGRHIVILPEDIVEEFQLEDGDLAMFYWNDEKVSIVF